MKSGLCTLLLMLFLSAPVWALEEMVTLNFKVSPPDAEVYIEGTAESARNPVRLGRADTPLLVERSAYPTGEFVVTFRAPGYQDLTRSFALPVGFKNLDVIDIPEGGTTITLETTSSKLRWIALGLGGLGIAVGGALFWRSGQRKTRDMATWVAQNVVPGDEEDPIIGKRLGEYWILERLGRGGMATVYRGVRVPDEGGPDEEAAIKVIHQHVADDPDFLARFRREVGITSGLVNPAIVGVFSAGKEEGRYIIAMELVRGKDLRGELPPDGFEFKQAMGLLRQIFGAVEHAHGKGIVHRDLKPENILLTEDGKVKLTDFGLARSHSFATVTATGNVLGTPAYMAPEQIQAMPFAPACDQYALGIIVFELLTGRLPFQADDAMQLLMQHLSAQPLKPSAVKPSLPVALDDVVARMLSKNPADRYADVGEASLALQMVDRLA